MPNILVIDDEQINHKLVASALEKENYQLFFALSGREGLQRAKTVHPDLIVTDVMMPDINGYELTKQLRRDPDFAHIPILVLSAQAALQNKLSSFEAGADDYLSKPFEPAEMAVRIAALLRRSEASRAPVAAAETHDDTRLIAIHSLKGGTGCSSLAVNLGVGLASLWIERTVILDLNMIAGQVALMLNATLKRTWADIALMKPGELEWEILYSIIAKHPSGVDFIAAPTFPTEAEIIKVDVLDDALHLLKRQYDYIVADLPHDFSDIVIYTLDIANVILMMVSPDLASLRAAAAALNTYTKLNYPADKIKLVLNATFPKYGLQKDKIETALGMPVTTVIPYNSDLFIQAINYGQPIVSTKPGEPVAGILENLAFKMSKEKQQKTRPERPTAAWLRVYKRYTEKKK